MWAGQPRNQVSCLSWGEIFLLSQTSTLALGHTQNHIQHTPCTLSSENKWGMRLTTHFQLMLRLRTEHRDNTTFSISIVIIVLSFNQQPSNIQDGSRARLQKMYFIYLGNNKDTYCIFSDVQHNLHFFPHKMPCISYNGSYYIILYSYNILILYKWCTKI